MVEVEEAAAEEHRLEHAEILPRHQRIAEGFSNPLHALVGLDLDQPALAAEPAAARHAVGLLRREGIF